MFYSGGGEEVLFFFSSRRRHTRFKCDWSSDVCSSDLGSYSRGFVARGRRAQGRAMNILVIGDVVGSPGRAILKKGLPLVFKKHDIDYCIANVENAAGGFGVTKEVCDELLDLGIDCMTSGNHIWDKKEIIGIVDLIPQLLRPLNYPPGQPGRGAHVGKGKRSGVPVATLNLSCRVFMNGAIDDPFRLGLLEVERLRKEAAVIIVDIHGEATSEKMALGYYLDGRVSAVVGTHPPLPPPHPPRLAQDTPLLNY